MIAHGVHLLGAGHAHEGDKIDYSVGVSEIRKVGTQVKQGEPLMMIHYNDESKLEQALNYFKDAYRLARSARRLRLWWWSGWPESRPRPSDREFQPPFKGRLFL
jgi:thymidine phosphorylase